MITYKCLKCSFAFTEADKAWDEAVDTGHCPRCEKEMVGFPIPKTMNKESNEYKVAKSKYAKIIPISVVIGLITLKLLPIFISPPHHPASPSENVLI